MAYSKNKLEIHSLIAGILRQYKSGLIFILNRPRNKGNPVH